MVKVPSDATLVDVVLAVEGDIVGGRVEVVKTVATVTTAGGPTVGVEKLAGERVSCQTFCACFILKPFFN